MEDYSNRKKICIVCSKLNGGGAEKASAMQSIMFHNLGYEVTIVTVDSGVSFNYKGKVFDLGQFKNKKDTPIRRISRLVKLKRFLNKNNFQYIVDNRPRNQTYREIIITKFIYTSPTIYVIHSFEESTAFTKYRTINKWLYKNEIMVCVSRLGRQKFEKLYGLSNIKTIYNAFDFKEINRLSQNGSDVLDKEKYIIYCGRLNDRAKNLRLLLESYKISQLKENSIKLLLLGDGEDLDVLKNYSEVLGISNNVVFKSFTKNPYPYIRKAMFLTLSSRSEGFAMVIPEALSLSTPVVSVDCNAGPKEIIKNRYNGLLVKNFDPKQLAAGFNMFVEDKELYNKCLGNSVSSVSKFTVEKITNDWKELLS
ncbi:glycosyltransferase [Cognatitamlana onchidii]|uniref:glycosyltransferase n=1 Tax=Cognatitamlana onchidii TaxID=2562860 RepID=UPI0010A669FD|nr:glycosyltransferase [Algibacter onchidii]